MTKKKIYLRKTGSGSKLDSSCGQDKKTRKRGEKKNENLKGGQITDDIQVKPSQERNKRKKEKIEKKKKGGKKNVQ